MSRVKVSSEKPPNWKVLEKAFGVEWGGGRSAVVVAYGDTIHCSTIPTDDVLEHEFVHLIQQKFSKVEAKKWWKKYIEDSEFRLKQETPAYKMQYKVLKNVIKDRNLLAKQLWRLATDMSSSQYGHIISHTEALRAIK